MLRRMVAKRSRTMPNLPLNSFFDFFSNSLFDADLSEIVE